MSDETYQKLEEAVRAHVADEANGAYLTGWCLAAAGAPITDGNATSYVYANKTGAAHEWLGLLWMAQRRAIRWEESGE